MHHFSLFWTEREKNDDGVRSHNGKQIDKWIGHMRYLWPTLALHPSPSPSLTIPISASISISSMTISHSTYPFIPGGGLGRCIDAIFIQTKKKEKKRKREIIARFEVINTGR